MLKIAMLPYSLQFTFPTVFTITEYISMNVA